MWDFDFDDWSEIKGGKENYRRVLLTQQNPSGGGFSKLAGKSYIELVLDTSDRSAQKIYADRLWGDIGFVHLGFDVRNMQALGEKLAQEGHGFTCDTKDVLSMGESTKVHCTYSSSSPILHRYYLQGTMYIVLVLYIQV